MKSSRAQPEDGQKANNPEIRRQLVGLIKKRNRRIDFTTDRPTRVCYSEILSPESGYPLTEASMWTHIVRFLESGYPLQRTVLKKPPGEIAWVCRARLALDSSRIYIKLQIIGSYVLLRSFHIDDYDD